MRKNISITGLDCAHCAAEFEAIVKKANGIEDAKMNFILEKMIVTAESEEAIDGAVKLALKAFPDAEAEL